ncbi:AraC family transcriptional regulator [Actinomadura barringtoniae]|uniref:AraC family transcriptional regulator n=1 Tax=Actinomadura barringtoniae TaxID=1427535 RepID=A0A939T8T3_9ACTN|nr:AraC family transcriptional regulator [Actinomadura barringtoniae]
MDGALRPGPDRAVWTRVGGIQGSALDLLAARIGSRHYAPHIHDEYAIGVCTDGVEVMDYRGERHLTGPGSIVVVEPGETHTGGPAEIGGFAYRVLYPGAALLAEGAGLTDDDDPASTETSGALPHFRDAIVPDPELAAELRRVHLVLSRSGDPLEGESRLLEVLRVLVRRHGCRTARSAKAAGRVHLAAGASGAARARVARAVADRLADELTDPPTLAELAADLGLSRYQLLRAFRDSMGMPPYAWLAQHRVGRARRLLDAGHRPAEAASLVGFADQAHLTRWFRRVLAVTPGEYRTSVRSGIRDGVRNGTGEGIRDDLRDGVRSGLGGGIRGGLSGGIRDGIGGGIRDGVCNSVQDSGRGGTAG